MSCGDQWIFNDSTWTVDNSVNFASGTGNTFATNINAGSAGTINISTPNITEYDLSVKNPTDPWIEALKKIKNKKDNTYILIMGRKPKEPESKPDWASVTIDLDWETVVFDNFDACNVAEQIIKKDNEKGLLGPRKYFYNNKKFFEMTEVN